MDSILESIIEIIKEGGKILLSASSLHVEGISKGGHANFVTEYDSKIQSFLIEKLHEILPEADFIGEENGLSQYKEQDRKGYAFVIDPIDGTNNFIKGYEPSVISIGLLREGIPFIGVICNPFRDQVYYAMRGQGAWLNGVQIHSSPEPLESSLISVGTSPYLPELHPKMLRISALYLEHGMDLRRTGSAAMDLCLLASGKTGVFFEPLLGLWDYVAGAVICQEAGCVMTDLDGKPLTYDGSSSVLCVSEGVSRGRYLPGDLMNA